MKRAFSIFLCLLLLFPALWSCGREKATPAQVVSAMQKAEKPSPAGRLYVLSAPPDGKEHPGDSLLAAMFGEGDTTLPAAFDHVEDAAFFVSYTNACELAVFRCDSADGPREVSGMCLRRLDRLKLYRTDGQDAVMLQEAQVVIRGDLVILLVSNDPEGALRALRRTL